MPTTTKYGVPYPSGTDPNDFATDIAAVANGITNAMAGYGEGLLGSRPAAASANKGMIWRGLDTDANGGYFVSTGSVWTRISPTPWLSWNPTFSITDGAGTFSSVVGGSYSTSGLSGFKYRILPGNSLEIDAEFSLSLTQISPPTTAFCGAVFTVPIAQVKQTVLRAEVQNDIARCFVASTYIGDALVLFPTTGFAAASEEVAPSSTRVGQWFTPATNTCYINGEYRIA